MVADSNLRPDQELIAGWCQWGLRWFWLAVLPLVLGASRSVDLAPAGVLAVYALAQVLLTAGLLRGHSILSRPRFAQALDMAAGLALILAGAGSTSAWLGLLVAAASSGCVAGAGGALRSSGAVMVLGGAGLGLVQGSVTVGLTRAGLHGFLLIPAGVLLGTLARRLVGEARDFRNGSDADLPTLTDGRSTPLFDDIEQPADVLEVLRAGALDALEANGVGREGLEALLLERHETRWFVAGASSRGVRDREHIEVEEAGLLAAALKSGVVQTSSAPHRDPVLAAIPSAQAWSCAACLPLHDGDDQIGVLLLGHREPDVFQREQRRMLEAVGREARLAARYARLYRDLQDERDRMTEMQEEARKKLARDLHDGPTQTIAAIAMRTNFARRELDRDLQGAQEELRKVEEMARQTTKEIRHMLFTLRPLILESRGLAVALHQFAQKVHDTHGQQIWVEADPGDGERLSGEQQGILFYIVEEAVTNAWKHAAAENVWVRLFEEDDRLTLEVEDDGVGFNVGAVDAHYEQRGSLGMVTMRERAELLEADFKIRSEESQGTLIRVAVAPEGETDEGAPRAADSR